MRAYYKLVKRYVIDLLKSRTHRIKIFNSKLYNFSNYTFDNHISIEKHWLYQFISSRLKINNSIAIIGINGARGVVKLITSKYKIFHTIENVNVVDSPWFKYKDYFLEDKRISISIGFDDFIHEKYIRFPFWIQTLFSPFENKETILKKCKDIEVTKNNSKENNLFCSFICRFDYFGDRAKFADLIETIAPINYPGNFRHNDDTLKSEFNDNKIEYLKQFKFNLCPENSNSPGYVTEKIFDAIKAGCIPIYWGSGNCPEPDILNQDRILFLRLNEDNTEVLQKIKYLNGNKVAYNEFRSQPVFTENAPEIIYGYFERLEKKLKEIIR